MQISCRNCSRNSAFGWAAKRSLSAAAASPAAQGGRSKNNHGKGKPHKKQPSVAPTTTQSWRSGGHKPDGGFSWVPPAYRGFAPQQQDSHSHQHHRGGGGQSSPNHYPRFHKHNNPNADPTTTNSGEVAFLARQRNRESKRAARAAREKAEELRHRHAELLQHCRDYRRHFGVTEENENNNNKSSSSRQLPQPRDVHQMLAQIQAALRDLHESDAPVSLQQIRHSEKDYQTLTRLLHTLALTACTGVETNSGSSSSDGGSSTGTDTDSRGYVALAEFVVRQWVQLARDRALLADAAAQWGAQHHRQAVAAANLDVGSEQDEEEEDSGVTGWFKKVVTGIFRPRRPHRRSYNPATAPKQFDGTDEENSSDDLTDAAGRLLAHQDPQFQVSQRLFRSVLTSIAATTVPMLMPPPQQSYGRSSSEQGMTTTTTAAPQGKEEKAPVAAAAEQESPYETAARRMMDLLDSMPPEWDPDTDSLRLIMDMLCRAGTLESARLCDQLYHHHPRLQYGLQYGTVLEAYLQAATRQAAADAAAPRQPQRQRQRDAAEEASSDEDDKGDDDDENEVQTIALEAWKVIRRHWDELLPKHRVERIMQCSVVLHCLSIAAAGVARNKNNNKDDRRDALCDKANSLAKAALGSPTWTQLLAEIEADEPRVDTQTLPVVNYLTQLYASSADKNPHLVESSKRMLHYSMFHRGGMGRFLVFPDAATCNAVLQALLERRQHIEIENKSSSNSNDDNSTAASTTTSKAALLEADWEFAQRVVEYMQRRTEVECWPNAQTQKLMFRFLDAINPENVGELAEDLLSLMEAKQFLSRNAVSAGGSSNATTVTAAKVNLSTYHRVLAYGLQEARKASSSSNSPTTMEGAGAAARGGRSLACERALRILDRLEVQSTPIAIHDRVIRGSPTLQGLYNLELRPVRKTYKLVLQICVDTAEDRETAADIALQVYRRMIRRGLEHAEDTTSLLVKCAAALPEESDKRREIEDLLASIESAESDAMESA